MGRGCVCSGLLCNVCMCVVCCNKAACTHIGGILLLLPPSPPHLLPPPPPPPPVSLQGSAEKQLYLASRVAVKDGALVLTTQGEPGGVRAPGGTAYNFSSGWVESRGLRFQAEGYVPLCLRLSTSTPLCIYVLSICVPQYLYPSVCLCPSVSMLHESCSGVGGVSRIRNCV